MAICKETMSPETIEAIHNMDDKKLGARLIRGYVEQNTPQEMVIILTAEL